MNNKIWVQQDGTAAAIG
ncbi:MAG: hypothetical protein ACKO90_10740, partial [Microcystis panniformis]